MPIGATGKARGTEAPNGVRYVTMRLRQEAYQALYECQKVHESFSDTVLRLVKERK